MIKMRQENDVTCRTCVVYVENETSLSTLIRKGVVYEEK